MAQSLSIPPSPPPDLSGYAKLSSQAPRAEAKTPTAGSMNEATRADHVHPRLSSATIGTLDSSGHATVTFTRTFPEEPVVTITAVENNTESPPDFKVKTFTQDANGNYTGCTIYGSRARPLPAVGALLTDLLKLAGFNVMTAAANVKFSILVIKQST